MTDSKLGYVCFYNGKRWETYADSMHHAHTLAVEHFKPSKSKRHMVHCVLAEKDGETVTHIATENALH